MPKTAETVETDVAVVGAGFAGLVAARRLVEADVDVVVLEARDRVGGRVLNAPLGDGKVVEVGGTFLGPTQDRAYALVAELGLETFPVFDAGLHLVEMEGRVKRYRRTPPVGWLGLLDLARVQRRLDGDAATVPLDRPWEARRAREWDGQTFAAWIERAAHTTAGRRFLRVVTDAVFAAEPEQLSALYALWYVHSGQGLEKLIATRGGAQQDRVVGGTQEIAERLAADLGDRVRLSAPVRRVAWSAGRVRIEADGVAVDARRAVVAVPPTLAGRISYDPALPAERDLLTQRMPMGTVIKCMPVYQEPFWREDGLTGQAASHVGPVCATYDVSPPDGLPGVLLAFVEARHAVELGALSLGERREAVLSHLARLFGPQAATPVDWVERDWAREEWSRGCYGAHCPPGALTQFGRALREPVGPIHWAGTETAEQWAGYMDGAVESGERAAEEVQKALV
jgi:monoamine oxidase